MLRALPRKSQRSILGPVGAERRDALVPANAAPLSPSPASRQDVKEVPFEPVTCGVRAEDGNLPRPRLERSANPGRATQRGAAVMLGRRSGGRRGPRRLLWLHLMEGVQSEPDPSSFLAFPGAGGIKKGKYGISAQTVQRTSPLNGGGGRCPRGTRVGLDLRCSDHVLTDRLNWTQIKMSPHPQHEDLWPTVQKY